jgi:peptide/nickel transport system ATP-binding protein
MTTDDEMLLLVEDLGVRFFTDHGDLRAVDGVSLRIDRGRTLALVGESGCGKSVTSYSILRLIQEPGRIVSGRILLFSQRAGRIDITGLGETDDLLYRLRGGLVSLIFQEPATALSPVHRVGDQIVEAIRLHQEVTPAAARRLALDLLKRVGVSAPERRFNQYPHEFSGGMRQRAVIAMALGCKPELLIADEPTTALDVTTQAQILALIKELQRDLGCSVLLITHDFGVVAQMADDVAVMYLGRIVEQGSVRDILRHPRHPYTQGLLRSLPSMNTDGRLAGIPGTVPSLTAIPAGCAFHPRCPHARPGLCDRGSAPPLRPLGPGHAAACLRAEEIAAGDPVPPSHPGS